MAASYKAAQHGDFNDGNISLSLSLNPLSTKDSLPPLSSLCREFRSIWFKQPSLPCTCITWHLPALPLALPLPPLYLFALPGALWDGPHPYLPHPIGLLCSLQHSQLLFALGRGMGSGRPAAYSPPPSSSPQLDLLPQGRQGRGQTRQEEDVPAISGAAWHPPALTGL